VVGNTAAAAAWVPLALPSAPASPITLRQFRVTGGPIYDIVAFDGVSTITLDRPYTEASAPAASYLIYQPYVPAPALDFKRWLSWVDPANMRHIRYKNLFLTQKELDRHDPSRTCYSLPIAVAAHDYVLYPGDTQRRPRFELWPHPVQEIGYVVEYMTKGDAVTASDVLPPQIPDQLIMARARSYGHQLAANQANVDVKQKAFHITAKKMADGEYFDLLNTAKNNDNSIFDSRVLTEESGPALNGPLDSNYLQDHVLYFLE
jgi:hypothetical protein